MVIEKYKALAHSLFYLCEKMRGGRGALTCEAQLVSSICLHDRWHILPAVVDLMIHFPVEQIIYSFLFTALYNMKTPVDS